MAYKHGEHGRSADSLPSVPPLRVLCMYRYRRAYHLLTSAAIGMALAAALACLVPRNGAATTPMSTQSRAGTVAPAGADGFAGIEWVRVPVPGGAVTAAVARPPGEGPFPVLVILHGTHGFAREYVRLAQDLSREGGVVAVAGCWFKGGQGKGSKFVTPIECPDAPEMPNHWSKEGLGIVSALVAAARALPGVRGDRVALFGHSRGGGAALQYVVERRDVQAAVLNSIGYPDEVVALAPSVSAPLLQLHGTADGPTRGEGGTEYHKIEQARKFEGALRQANKPYKAVHFDGSGHNSLFTDAKQYDETVQLVAKFLRDHLRK